MVRDLHLVLSGAVKFAGKVKKIVSEEDDRKEHLTDCIKDQEPASAMKDYLDKKAKKVEAEKKKQETRI